MTAPAVFVLAPSACVDLKSMPKGPNKFSMAEFTTERSAASFSMELQKILTLVIVRYELEFEGLVGSHSILVRSHGSVAVAGLSMG